MDAMKSELLQPDQLEYFVWVHLLLNNLYQLQADDGHTLRPCKMTSSTSSGTFKQVVCMVQHCCSKYMPEPWVSRFEQEILPVAFML